MRVLKSLSLTAATEVARRGALYNSWIKHATLNQIPINRLNHGRLMDQHFLEVTLSIIICQINIIF